MVENKSYLSSYNNDTICEDWEYELFAQVMNGYNINKDFVKNITAADPVPVRMSYGLSKTDVIMTVNDSIKYPISVKQSTARKVAFAEFDVNTIVKEVGITDSELIRLLKLYLNFNFL